MGESDEGVLDPWVAEWQESNPEPDWMAEGFPLEMRELARGDVGFPPTREIDQIADEVVDGVPIRIYRGNGPQTGLVVYVHGGAFIVGSIGIMDNVARELAHAADAVVVSVGYRLAPEHPFPEGLDDCEAVTRWALDQAARFDLSPASVAVAGESAGGNLATAVALRLRDAGDVTVAGQVLIYPCTDGPSATYPSREQFGHAQWVWDVYGGGRDLEGDPYAIPMRAATLRGLPPTLLVLGGCDFLRDEGRAYAARLREDLVEVDEVCYPGQPHGFINRGFPAATPAWDRIGGWLRSLFAVSAA
ncbi:MAG: alpha/beta hydrolase [Acidimicrobiales bacterium]